MLIIRIFLLVTCIQKLFAMKLNLLDWLKVYQQKYSMLQ